MSKLNRWWYVTDNTMIFFQENKLDSSSINIGHMSPSSMCCNVLDQFYIFLNNTVDWVINNSIAY